MPATPKPPVWSDPLEQLQASSELAVERFITFKVNQLSIELERQWTRTIRERAGISLSQWRILAVLRAGPSTFAAVVDAIGINKALMSRSVRELQELKLLDVQATPDDARSLTLTLTTKGRRLLSDIMPLALQRQRHLLSALTSAERRAFYSAVDKLRDSAREWGVED